MASKERLARTTVGMISAVAARAAAFALTPDRTAVARDTPAMGLRGLADPALARGVSSRTAR